MKLCEHPDFEQAILQAEQYFETQGLRASLIEKDYYVTEVLRIVGNAVGDKVIFKGGTSLSKGWNLINRFSEDVDLFLDPHRYSPVLTSRGIDREARALRDAVNAHPALNFTREGSHTTGGFGRNDRFEYQQRFGEIGGVSGSVLLETGTASGRQPTEIVELRSLLSQFLADTGYSLNADDESSFPFRLLHFRRTFVEKLFAIHAKVELLKRDGRPLGTQARHYYDLYQLSRQSEVMAMLNSDEYQEIKTDYDQISSESFGRDYLPPDNLRFHESDALFPPANIMPTIRQEYESQCQQLCYGDYPSWDDVQARFIELRSFL